MPWWWPQVWNEWDPSTMSRRHAEIDAEIEADPDAEIYTVAERRRREMPAPWL